MQDNSSGVSPTSSNLLIGGMLSGYRWIGPTLTYAFPTAFSQYGASYPATYSAGFTPFSAEYQAGALYWLQQIASVSGLSFTVGAAETATLRFGRFDDPANLAYGFIPGQADTAGDMWFANNANTMGNPGTATMHALLHELGHALGLKHPWEGPVVLPANYDVNSYTTMSYNNYVGGNVPGVYNKTYTHWEQALPILDIQGLQFLYGANFNTNSGDSIYRFDPVSGTMTINGVSQGSVAGGRIFRSIWDGNGTDTYDFSNFSQNQTINLNPGEWSTFSTNQLAATSSSYVGNTQVFNYEPGNIANPFLYNGDTRSLIENAVTGSGNDLIVGNAANNRINAGNGDDTLFGGDGSDWLFGEGGNDILIGGTGGDALDGGAGFDYISYAAASAGLVVDLGLATQNTGEAAGDSYAGVEGLIGSAYDDVLRGDGQGNWIYGGVGNDVELGRDGDDVLLGERGDDYLYGEGGADNLIGGVGNDHLIGGLGADVLNGGDGFDYAHYDLAPAGLVIDIVNNPDNTGEAVGDTFVSIESVVGSSFNDSIRGNELTNWLYGGEGLDFLYGRGGDDYLLGGGGTDYLLGGAGTDFLYGGAGTDVLYGEGGADRFVATAGTGIDYIMDLQVGSGDAILVDVAALGVSTFAQVQARMVQSGGDTIIGFNGDAILVVIGVTPAQLTAAEFVFG